MDHLKVLIDTLEPLSGPSWLFKFGCNFLINKASVDKIIDLNKLSFIKITYILVL